MNNRNTDNNKNNVEEVPPSSLTTMVECEECGHRLPEANMAIHRAKCHSYQRREPTIHQEDNQHEETGDGSINEVIEAVDESISGEYVAPPPTTTTTNTSITTQQSPASSSTTSPLATPTANQWPCPRCTLLNPNTSNTCDACLYQRLQNNAINANSNIGPRMHVNVAEVDPQAVGRAVGVASWAIIGALMGGPVGALVAGGSAAAISGIQHQLQQQRQRNANSSDNPGRQRPFFTVTTTSYSSTPWGGTTMSVTSNASGQRRTMTIRDVDGNSNNGNNIPLHQMSRSDQRILQFLMLNAINQGTATPETANQMTLEELLQQFGFPNHDDHHQGRRRGATPELINSCSTLETLDTKESISNLKDNQSTCNICLEEFKEGDTIRKLNHCSHTFHKECIDEWLSRVPACPICKNELNHHQHEQQQRNDGLSPLSYTPTTRTATGP